ncbi:MAG TPA: CDP-diacylglycerol--serine O-phosphatidyltransferase [Pirellulales bacterium]|nr:CDP-diacylglycerol--serine O-phosphatidyltransferase [Pirellulales bacterium]
MHRIRTVAVLPTLFTLANLVCGFFAIVVAARVDPPKDDQNPRAEVIGTFNLFKAVRSLDKEDPSHNCMLSAWLIFLAMIFDALDGHVARLAKTTSDFGAQLDSLCDVVTFGVAPAFLLVKMCPHFEISHHRMVWVIAALYAACAAMRLARFNVETDDEDDHMHFTGLPSPAAAAAIASFAILFYTLRKETSVDLYPQQLDNVMQYVLPCFAVLVAILMVSRIPYPHLVNQLGQASFAHLAMVVLFFAGVMLVRGFAVPLISVVFVLHGPVLYVWQEYVQRRPHKEPLF